MPDKPGNNRGQGHGRRHVAGAPRCTRRGHFQERNQADANHGHASQRDPAGACHCYVADLEAHRTDNHDLQGTRLQRHAGHGSAKHHGQRRKRPAAQQEGGSQQGAAKHRESPHDHGASSLPGMLTAAIVAASGCRVVCLRAYARGETAASCRWVRGQMRRDRRPRHLVAMDATIKIDGLHKRFGETQALDGMTFTVRPGQVTGFIGPNGAGKSTTMRVILGLDAPDAGTATIGGYPYRSLRKPLCHVGSLLDAGALQPGRSGRNHLLWLAHSQGLKAGRVDEVIALTGMASAARRKAGGYSLGMRQRLGIAAALLGDPPVLMLDEPFNGMDPEGIVWVREFLRSLAAEGRAVLVSSHLMSELQEAAGHLVIVGRGKVIVSTSVAELIESASGDRVTVRTSAR